MNNDLLIQQNQAAFQTYTNYGTGTVTTSGTNVSDAAKDSESYQNFIKAFELVNQLSQTEPVPQAALQTALDNLETARMVITSEMKKNPEYANENPYLMTLVNEESFKTAEAPAEKENEYIKKAKEAQAAIDKGLLALEKAARFQEAYLAWFSSAGNYRTEHKNKDGVVDGVRIDYGPWLAALGNLIGRFKGSDGVLATFDNEADARNWSKDNADSPVVLEDGVWKVKMDVKALENTRDSLTKENAKQGSGFTSLTTLDAIERMLEINKGALDIQIDKLLNMLKSKKEEIDGSLMKLNDFLIEDRDWLRMANQ